MRRLVPHLLALLAGCSDDGGIGLSLLRVVDLVESDGRDAAEVAVFVSRRCFYSVAVGGALQASGRWVPGEQGMTFGTSVLQRCRNDVRIQVAADDGSSAAQDVPVWWCRTKDCETECSGAGPDAGPDAGADSGVVDPYPGPQCDPCDDTSECGGLPNLCVSVEGSTQGLCGTSCETDACPAGLECLGFTDGAGTLVTQVCLPWPPAPTCP